MKNNKKYKVDRLIKFYNNAASNLVEAFLVKQGLTNDDGNPVSFEPMDGKYYNFIEVADYYLSIDDILTDMDKNIEKGVFFQWYDCSIEWTCNGYRNVNYNSYLMGFRHKKRSWIKEFVYTFKKSAKLRWYRIVNYRQNKELTTKFKEEYGDLLNNK